MKAPVVLLMLPTFTAALSLKGPLDVPDMTPYDPVEVLCTLGKNKDGEPNVQTWCKDWMKCIKDKATPAGTAAAVKAAWSPADCKEICGSWPVTSEPEGVTKTSSTQNSTQEMPVYSVSTQNSTQNFTNKSSTFLQRSTRKRVYLFNTRSKDECQQSCMNFQESLSSCVATIMFEPGKTAAMGLSKSDGTTSPEICTRKDSPCMPDLPVKKQKCLGHKTKATLDHEYEIPAQVSQDCKMITMHLEECKSCPQMQDNYRSQYTAFTGGCMDQLNAYWQATHPKAGSSAIPGANGCTVHKA